MARLTRGAIWGRVAQRVVGWGEATDEPPLSEQRKGSRGRSPHHIPFEQHALGSTTKPGKTREAIFPLPSEGRGIEGEG
jgi:hypothetical protein